MSDDRTLHHIPNLTAKDIEAAMELVRASDARTGTLTFASKTEAQLAAREMNRRATSQRNRDWLARSVRQTLADLYLGGSHG